MHHQRRPFGEVTHPSGILEQNGNERTRRTRRPKDKDHSGYLGWTSTILDLVEPRERRAFMEKRRDVGRHLLCHGMLYCLEYNSGKRNDKNDTLERQSVSHTMDSERSTSASLRILF